MTHNILYYYHYCTLQLSRDNWKKKSAGVTFENKNGQYEMGTFETEGIIDTTTLLIYHLCPCYYRGRQKQTGYHKLPFINTNKELGGIMTLNFLFNVLTFVWYLYSLLCRITNDIATLETVNQRERERETSQLMH